MGKKKKSLEETAVKALTQKKLTITTAESCTGGLLAARLINASGVSGIFDQGIITYSNQAKRKQLGVRKKSLKRFGAVSRQVAKEMAAGAAKAMNADIALSVTGIAGPDGGSKKKPVGLVYIGCYYQKKVTVKKYRFNGNRRENREKSAEQALKLLMECLG